jgi:oligo-1,6-glucosidase/alpha-glucosidase
MTEGSISELSWWKKTTVYQIYPRSFFDSSGDGIGDLNGIISKLDYLKGLGIETIWISPFFVSPTWKPYKQHDCGYDITDYRDVNPEYGSLETADLLIKEIHDRDMKIVLDMVLNHTSVEHEWFKESRSSKDSPKRDWYIWRDGKKPGGKKPPNNWRAMIMGSPWHYDRRTDQWYYAAFLGFQPDLNYRNPEVQQEMLDTLRFWLKKGVDGFRLDIINALFEDPEFRDAPFTPKLFSGDLDVLFKSSRMNLNHPDTIEFCKKLRTTIDEFDDPSRFMVGEIIASLPTIKRFLGEDADGLNLAFLFKSLDVSLNAQKVRRLIELYEEHLPDPFIPTWVFGNHDRFRRISKLNGSVEKAKLNAALQLTARGVPFIYYGEEIGMEQADVKATESLDPLARHFRRIPPFVHSLLEKHKQSIIRDGCRTPMQWNDTENAGFSEAGVKTWLPVTPSYKERNVLAQEKDPDSLLHCYSRFLRIRREMSALHSGHLKIIPPNEVPKDILSYVRSFNGEGTEQQLHIFLNFSSETVSFIPPVKNLQLLTSTTIRSNPLQKNGEIVLTPWEGIVLKGE